MFGSGKYFTLMEMASCSNIQFLNKVPTLNRNPLQKGSYDPLSFVIVFTALPGPQMRWFLHAISCTCVLCTPIYHACQRMFIFCLFTGHWQTWPGCICYWPSFLFSFTVSVSTQPKSQNSDHGNANKHSSITCILLLLLNTKSCCTQL